MAACDRTASLSEAHLVGAYGLWGFATVGQVRSLLAMGLGLAGGGGLLLLSDAEHEDFGRRLHPGCRPSDGDC